MASVKIDGEFQSLIPPLTDDEFSRLEKSILTEGVREPIITWNGTIIDGHNRYRICQKHGLSFKTTEREFDSRDAAIAWICDNQLGRRNLDPGQRAALVIEQNEAEVREAARERQILNLKQNQEHSETNDRRDPRATTESNEEKGRTHEILARQAGVSPTTVKRVMGVKRRNPELYKQIRNGEITARDAYSQVTNEKYCKKGDECSNYLDADRDLRENVAVYTVSTLLIELTASAENLRDSWAQSIEINQSMGVKLKAAQKRRLEKAVANLLNAIQKIKEEQND